MRFKSEGRNGNLRKSKRKFSFSFFYASFFHVGKFDGNYERRSFHPL